MNGTAYGPDLSLSPTQEGLLLTALSSNPRGSPQSLSGSTNGSQRPASDQNRTQQYNGAMANGTTIYTSPVQENPGSEQLGNGGSDESPFLDYELEDGTFDWDNSVDQLFGDLPGSDFNDDGEHHDKRKASTDADGEEEGTSKRRESDEKSGKKPGRKPLTGEPTTKRKAQNRAAQRAFRERKERHLKDLETKVDDLEKASESTNHENGRLRAQVEKLNMELKEYRKRLALNSTAAGHSPPQAAPLARNHYNGNDFQFAFPKFGDLPGSSFMSNGAMAKTSSPVPAGQRPASSSNTSQMGRKESSGSTNERSPTNINGPFTVPQGEAKPYEASIDGFNNNNVANSHYEDLNGLFSPSVLETASRNNSTDYLSYTGSNNTSGSGQQGTNGNNSGLPQVSKVQRGSSTSITASPASSMSQNGLDSSCGTTPEASPDSPDNRKPSERALNTINEEANAHHKIEGKESFCDEWAKACGDIANPVPPMLSHSDGPSAPSSVLKSPFSDINGIDWLAQQNGGQFDPVLFGDYRDPQDSILNNTFGEFFNDAFPLQDFGSPYNTGEVASPPQKRDLMKEIEVQQNGGPDDVVPGEAQNYMSCDKVWERIKSSEKVQSGEIDMDDLCSQLKSKAKCSGSGAVINEKDVDRILGPSLPEQQGIFKMFS